MLKNVSWSVYLEIVLILLVIYYVVVGFVYYKEEFKNLLNGKLQQKKKIVTNDFKDGNGDLDELQSVVNDLQYAVLNKANAQVNKEELLIRLQRRLYNYEGLQRPAFRYAINNYIITNAKEINGVTFSENELNGAWDELPQ